jgi:hypothetical protein
MVQSWLEGDTFVFLFYNARSRNKFEVACSGFSRHLWSTSAGDAIWEA